MKKIILSLFLTQSFFITEAQWTKPNTTGAITGRSNSSAVLDPLKNRMIVFGGNTSTGAVNEIWSLDLMSKNWTKITAKPGKVPAGRSSHNAMFETAKNRMLIWSGQGNELYNDVWAFNLSDSTWQELFADGNVADAPLKRYGTVAVFDPVKNQLVNFAGFTTSGRFEDTWTFLTDSLKWKNRSNTKFPLKRCLHTSCYAEDTRQMLVFGGQSSGNLKDLWLLNLDNYIWEELTPALTPSARHFSSLVYSQGKAVLFGGNSLNQNNYSGALNDLWVFSVNDKKWDTIAQGDTKPSRRLGHTAIYNPSSDEMILFGGDNPNGSLNAETWVLKNMMSTITGNKTEKLLQELEIFPNPFNTEINFRYNSKLNELITIRLFDTYGKLQEEIFHQNHQGTLSLQYDSEHLAPGLYLLHFQSGSSSSLKRLIKY